MRAGSSPLRDELAWEPSSVPSALVAGRRLHRRAGRRAAAAHPSFDLVAVTSRSDAGRRLDDLYPQHRVPLVLDELDLDRHAEVDAAIVAYPHGAAAPVVAELRERGVKVVDLSADFRLRDLAAYADWYGEHGAPELFGDAASTGCPSCTATRSRRRPRGQPRLLSDRHAAGARAAGAPG